MLNSILECWLCLKAPSISSMISLPSTRLALFNSLFSERCHWGCKKKQVLQNVLYEDEDEL